MKVPNCENGVVLQAKITSYLLNPTHPDGAGKARFFAALGYSIEAWSDLANAFLQLLDSASEWSEVESRHGMKYIVDGSIAGRQGQREAVRTVWIVEHGETAPRLVTAYPSEEGPDDD